MPARESQITNARIVTADTVVDGTVVVRDGVIAAVESGPTAAATNDWDGDWLLPGLVELHTDNLERHVIPRPGVVWPFTPALIAHDAELVAAGITTVFDALRVGEWDHEGTIAEWIERHEAAVSRLRELDAPTEVDVSETPTATEGATNTEDTLPRWPPRSP